MTFVEVQLGSGGVLCVAQGTAQSHGKEGEDQRVSAHQLHLGLCNLFSFCRANVAKWGPPKEKSNKGFSSVLQALSKTYRKTWTKTSACMVWKNMGLLHGARPSDSRGTNRILNSQKSVWRCGGASILTS